MEPRKVAIVTGGATGIGRAVALRLAQLGVNLVVNYSRSEQEALETAELVKAAGVECLLQKADVSKDLQVKAMLENAISHFGKLDYLVNCAGTTDFVDMSDLEGLKEEYWDRAMGVNVKGLFFVCRAASPYLKASGGSIVNITSIAGLTGKGSSIAYAASKAAAISVTKSLALVLAPEVRVNSVAPGVVMTRWIAGNEKHIEKMSAGTPLRKVCQPDDVAEIVISLLSASSMMTGQTLVVDGGFTMM